MAIYRTYFCRWCGDEFTQKKVRGSSHDRMFCRRAHKTAYWRWTRRVPCAVCRRLYSPRAAHPQTCSTWCEKLRLKREGKAAP